MKKRLLFVVNPVSGVGKQHSIEEELERHLDKNLIEYTLRYTEQAHHGTALAREAVAEGYDGVVAVGGDGSVNDVVSGLTDSNVALGIIPCGSGNGLARCLKIPLRVPHAIDVLNNFKVAKIDTIALNDKVVASIAGIGFDAHVAQRMKQAKVRGLQAYAKIIIDDYFSYKMHSYRMDIDGQTVERKAWFISFANSTQFGYNTAVAPLAKLDDGLIDICIVDRIPLSHLPLTAPLMYLNHFELSQHVEYFKARQVTVYNNDDTWVNVDGEGMPLGRELHLLNRQQSLSILVP